MGEINKPFIDLHTHTTYSQLDGMIKINDYIEFAKEHNLEAISITDHGNIDGIIDVYCKCKENNIKPILGSEFYCSNGIYNPDNDDTKNNFHLILIAKNNVGYKNLLKLTTFANMENFYRKPRITFEKLKEHSEGLICSTACVGSQFAYYINNYQAGVAGNWLLRYRDLFKDDFYIEYGYHYFEDEKQYISSLIEFATRFKVKTIITNDSHYLRKDDELAHKILMCKGDKQTINDASTFDYTHNYYKSKEEIIETFSEFPEININQCINNIYEIIDKCDIEIEFGKYIYPELPLSDGETQNQFLIRKVKEGLRERYPVVTDEIKDRVKCELSVITKMNYSGYFNIVSDYVNWAKNNGIRVGTARGSAAGCMIAYLLKITEVDPLKYNLIFERFLNPDRVSLPDVDADFESSKRHLVIQYLQQKYGIKSAVPISTKGYLKGKSAIKTVASRLGLNFVKYNSLLSGIKDPQINTVDKILESDDKLKKLYQTDEEFVKVIDLAKKLEGNIQSTGQHAAGICICNHDISDIAPIVKTKDGLCTAWSDKIIEKIGLLKYDILGLSNLSILDNCLSRINDEIDIENLPLDNPNVYKMLQNGASNGIFQLESSGMKSLLKRLKPENINHIDAVIALFRPGALQFIDEYIKNKNNPDGTIYFDNRVKDVLKLTYGQLCYQEQVMSIAQVLAGYTMSEADSLRRAIGKKNLEEMKSHEERFISGCIKNNVEPKLANKLYNQIVEFANYSFNRCIDGDFVFKEIGISLNELYKNGFKDLYLTSYSIEDKIFFKDKVLDIIDTGINHIFEFSLSNGKKIQCTKNHKFLCTDMKYYTVSEIVKLDLEIMERGLDGVN